MTRVGLACLCFATATLLPYSASAVASAEVYTSAAYGYGRLEARMRFAPGEGVVGSFFLWKVGSEAPNAFWAELDFEKLNGDCHFETNAIYGNPESNHNQQHPPDSCATYRTYTYEWTPDYVAWLVDGMEIRRDTGATPTAFAQNAASGMQFRFNVWPGDASFGGNFNPNILPVHQYIDWVQFSSYEGGTFTLDWREDFNGSTLPAGWLTANWGSPKNLSTHRPGNVNLIDGYLVLSLTADNAVGPAAPCRPRRTAVAARGEAPALRAPAAPQARRVLPALPVLRPRRVLPAPRVQRATRARGGARTRVARLAAWVLPGRAAR